MFRVWSVSQPALVLSMGTVSSAKQVSFSSTSSSLFPLFIKRKSSEGTPAVEPWSKKQFSLLGNINKTPSGSHSCHLPSPPLNGACEGKWNRNVAQTLIKERKELKKISSVLSLYLSLSEIKAKILIRSELGSCSAGRASSSRWTGGF